jgi:hypothetical protein
LKACALKALRALSALRALKALRADAAASGGHPAARARDRHNDERGVGRGGRIAVELVMLVFRFDIGKAAIVQERRVNVLERFASAEERRDGTDISAGNARSIGHGRGRILGRNAHRGLISTVLIRAAARIPIEWEKPIPMGE